MGQLTDIQAMLKDDLNAWLTRVKARYAWGADAGIALAAPGKLLSVATPSTRIPQGFWGLLPYEVADYCATSPQNAYCFRRLSVACELLLCALDYFDELEDNDDSEARRTLGDGPLLNCATALYQEGFQILIELDTSFNRPLHLASIASEELRLAMSGQHLDLLSEKRSWDEIEPEECIVIAEAKSGGLCRMACRLACALVDAPDPLATHFAEIGLHIGLAAQLENDMHDLEQTLFGENGQPLTKTDLLREKKTYPLVLAYQTTLQKNSSSVDSTEGEGQHQQLSLETYREALQQTWASAVFHRLSAAVLVEPIEQLRGAAFPPGLRLILGLDLNGC